MSPTVRLSLALLGAVLFWVWTIYGFIAGVVIGYGPDGGGVSGRFGAFMAVVMTLVGAIAFTRWALVIRKRHARSA